MHRERRRLLRYLIKVVIGCALAAGSSAALTTARTQTDDIATYPNRPIRVIIAVAAGGTMDVVARIVGQKLTEALGQPIVIENKPGAQTIIGTEFAARARSGWLHSDRGPSFVDCHQSGDLPQFALFGR
jgi:tripartite-type tricarboxylate transporter receptor subunit TctC